MEIIMQRKYQSTDSCFQNNQALTHQTAFHEAGHAAGIYLGNKQKQLPPVFFQIVIKQTGKDNEQLVAKVIGGRLIQNMPIEGFNTIYKLTKEQQCSYQCAYEADIINLLIGPLAEAKYVSIRDDEAFDFRLLNLHALNFYGGNADVDEAYAYLDNFIPSKIKQKEKMHELFLQAFQFVEDSENWKCIMNLGNYILNSEHDVISCEQAIEFFEPST